MTRIESENDLDTLRQMALLLAHENERLRKENAKLKGKDAPEQLALELSRLEEQIAAMKARLYGDSSERREKESSNRGSSSPQTGHGPTPQPELPVVETTVDLADDQRICPSCEAPLVEWKGHTEDSDLIDVAAAQYLLRKVKRKKYRCSCGNTIKTAPVPPKLATRGRYSLDFAAKCATDKFANALPLERQTKMMRRLGLVVTGNTLWDQIRRLAHELKPIYDALQLYILSADVVGADETWWRLMGKKPTKRWWVWSLTTPDAVWFHIDPSRSAKTATTVIGDYHGVLITDGYAAYQSLARASPTVTLAMCWSHARRKFVEIEDSQPSCTEAIELIGKLFALDRQTVDPHQCEGDAKEKAIAARQAKRRAEAPAILEQLRAWAARQTALPRSSLRKAIDYMISNWARLTLFVDDPLIPLSNNDTERAIRGTVLGRKNFYGCRSKNGTEVCAVFYSLLETAARNGLNPQQYLTNAALGLMDGIPPEKLLPLADCWAD